MAPLSRSAVNAALERLDALDRALLELSFRRGLPDTELGSVLGVSVDEIGHRKHAAIARLRGELDDGHDATTAELVDSLEEPAAPELEEPAEPEAPEPAATAAAPTAPVVELVRRLRPRLLPLARRAPEAALLLLPGALVVYLGFEAGGYFAGGPAAAALVVALALVLRATLAAEPAAGLGRLGGLAVAALVGFAGWVLLSGSWSDAPARALIEFDRALLYVLALLLFASVARTPGRTRTVLYGVVGGATLLCLVGLASRILPGVISSPPQIAAARLSYPLTYWNALGLMCVLAIVGCAHLAASEREPAPARVLGAAALPALATTLYFTFSRGAIVAGAIAVVVYVVAARPWGALTAAVAVLPATAVAVVVAYGADRLSSTHPTAAAASGQAHHVALVTGLCMLAAAALRALLLPLDRRLGRIALTPPVRRTLAGGVAGAVGLALLITLVGTSVPHRLDRQYHRFVNGTTLRSGTDVRGRLTDPANNGRLDEWRIALDAFDAHPLKGNGAGTYQELWARHRPIASPVIDGHSLYLETLGELGLVGMALLGTCLVAIGVGIARRVRGPERGLYAAVLAMAVGWALHAGIDWDWEMPAVTLWLFCLGGLALARSPAEPRLLREPARPVRVLVALGLVLLAVTPLLVYRSQAQLNASASAFRRGDCARAVDRALASNASLSVRPEPFELLGYCDVRLGRPRLGVTALQEAVKRDPNSWELRYGLALVRGAAGLDPRAEARRALTLNPRERKVRDAVAAFRSTTDPAAWRRRALQAPLPVAPTQAAGKR